MRILLFVFSTLFLFCTLKKSSNKELSSKEKSNSVIYSKLDSGGINVLSIFLDSIVKTTEIYYNNPSVSTSDTINLGKNTNNVKYRTIQKLGKIDLINTYYNITNYRPFEKDSDSCSSIFQIGSHTWKNERIQCDMPLECPEHNEFTYKNSKFTYLRALPSDNCISRNCRVICYPVFAMSNQDTSFYLFENVDDVSGLRFGDFNKDNFLDFLVVDSGFSDEGLLKINKKKDKNVDWECDESECYTITAITYKNGKWKKLKDKNNKEYYFLITLDDPLNPNSSFNIMDNYWPM
jgi:hypothetical protein